MNIALASSKQALDAIFLGLKDKKMKIFLVLDYQ